MLITDLIVSILLYLLIFLTCFTFGEFFLKLIDLNFKELNTDKNSIKPVIGFSIIYNSFKDLEIINNRAPYASPRLIHFRSRRIENICVT